jgi:AcrR family transcriptional regulator
MQARVHVRDATREALAAAATDVFAERGYDDATVREISSRAGVNVALIKYHFGGKQGLYAEVLRRTLLGAGHALVPVLADGSLAPDGLLRAIIRTFVFRLLSSEGAESRLRLLAHEFAKPTPALSRIVREIVQPNYDRMRRIVGDLLRRSPDDEKTCLCTLSIVSQIILYARIGSFFRLLRPALPLTRPRLERIADHIADFSLAYLRSAS